MRFLAVALLGLASVGVAEITGSSTWSDLMGDNDLPQCVSTCLNDYYDSTGLEDKCGSSDKATINCICGVKSGIDVDDNDPSSCIQSKCNKSDLSKSSSEINSVGNRFKEAMSICSGSSKSSETGGSSSLVPNFDTMLASGALLLTAAVL